MLRVSLTPLHRIVANSKMLQETGTWDQVAVNDLAQAATSLSEILNDTLDLSKIEEGKIEFNMTFQQPKSILDMVLDVTRANAAKKEIKLESIYSKTVPELISLDKARVTQVVMNLVGNAIKFTPREGSVTVEARWLWNCGKGGDCEKCVGNVKPPVGTEADMTVRCVHVKASEPNVGKGVSFLLRRSQTNFNLNPPK